MWPQIRMHTELIRHHKSRTAARDKVYLALKYRGACSVQELIKELKGVVHQATVYRTIKVFLRIGVASRPRHGIVELAHPFTQHHHHFICIGCERKVNFNDEQFEQRLVRMAQSRKFELTLHHLELSGYCGYCSK